jgi:Xaa-Pro aminopeptidase
MAAQRRDRLTRSDELSNHALACPAVRFDDLVPGPAPQAPLEVYLGRRRRLAESLGPGRALVVATHPVSTFSNDVEYPFRPHSSFWYLTGFGEPESVLVLRGGSGESTLFLRERKPEAEIWTGRRLGPQRAPAALGVDRAFAVGELSSRLEDLLRGVRHVEAVTAHHPAIHRRVRAAAGRRLASGAERLAEMRVRKDPHEVRLLRKACDLGVAAHLAAAATLVPGGHERHPEAAFVHHARHHGSTGVGYGSICGCGENAAVLHYVQNRSRLREGQFALLDMGCEWGYYTSDITRTYPVGGQMSTLQSRLYQVVLDAHRAGLREVRPGNAFRAPHDAAVRVLAEGLVDLGYIPGSVEQAIAEGTYRRFFMHGTSHFLGLDVHDAGWTRDRKGRPRTLEAGMVLTVEPGLYFNPEFTKCPPGTRGIGIRIEDDVLVTEDGHQNLTRRLPVSPQDMVELAGRR